MTDVAACTLALLRCSAIRQAAEASAGRPLRDDADLARLAVIAFLHDIGKANAGFQARFWRLESDTPRSWPSHCGHSADGWVLFSDAAASAGAGRILAGLPPALAEWGDGALPLLRASISHHGRPVDDEGARGASVWNPVRAGATSIYDPAEAVAVMGQRIQQLYPSAFVDKSPPLPDSAAFVHFFAGLIQLADWLGSDTREGFFPYSKPGEDRANTATARAAHAVRAVGLDVDVPRRAVAKQGPDFVAAFGVTPRAMQSAMADDALGPVVVLEAETGSGKTEAALWRFLHLFRADRVDGLYFALPTRVAATQLHDRVVAFVERVWPTDAPVVVRALPGYTAADGATFTKLPDFRVLWADKPGDQEAERRWAAEAPKRYLAATIAVGTVDQALLGALQIKHAHLRQAMLARSLLVVDEVHASDAYMTALLERLLSAHVACGGQALLLSATLGAAARTRFLNVGTTRPHPGVPPLAAGEALPYPAISTRAAGGPVVRAVGGNPRHKLVHWRTLDFIDDPERIAALAVKAAAEGARVLVVRNTVPAAVATLCAVEALTSAQQGDWLFKVHGVSTLHHSRFSRQDRPRLDAAVQAQIGKHRERPGGRIVVGTQTLEQSLDIDADLLITDLCPMDVLLQRLGRLHRHARPSVEEPQDTRPANFAAAQALILTPTAGDLAPLLKRAQHGLGPIHTKEASMQGVYVDVRSLEATRRLVNAQPTRRIPDDNRMLVERATHGGALDEIAGEMGPEWQEFGTQYEGAVGARASIARLQALPYAEAYYPGGFPDDEHKIGSRLGAADRLVVFDPPPVGPFGALVRELAIRHHQLPRGLPPDAEAACVRPLPGSGGFNFSLGESRYRYSRFGLERLKKEEDDAA